MKWSRCSRHCSQRLINVVQVTPWQLRSFYVFGERADRAWSEHSFFFLELEFPHKHRLLFTSCFTLTQRLVLTRFHTVGGFITTLPAQNNKLNSHSIIRWQLAVFNVLVMSLAEMVSKFGSVSHRFTALKWIQIICMSPLLWVEELETELYFCGADKKWHCFGVWKLALLLCVGINSQLLPPSMFFPQML